MYVLASQIRCYVKSREINFCRNKSFKKWYFYSFIGLKFWFWQESICGNMKKLLTVWKSREFTLTLFDKNFVKATFFKKFLKRWFHEIKIRRERISCFSTLPVLKSLVKHDQCQKIREINYLIKTLIWRKKCWLFRKNRFIKLFYNMWLC